jgi:hypothetical protein
MIFSKILLDKTLAQIVFFKQHSTAQHSTAQHSTAQHSTAQHSTAQHSTAQHSTAQHSTAYKDKIEIYFLLSAPRFFSGQESAELCKKQVPLNTEVYYENK